MSDDSDESNSFEVTVLLADGKEVRVEVRPDDTIEDVKERLIAEIEGSSWQVGRWSPELITLASGHLPLNDDDTVAESGLRAESAIVQHYTSMCPFGWLLLRAVLFGKDHIFQINKK